MKVCKKCGEEKYENDFFRRSDNPEKFEGSCKVCKTKYKREHYQSNKQKYRENRKIYYELHKDAIHSYKVNWQRSNPDKVKNSQLWHEYKIRLEEYNIILLSQNGVCKICKQTSSQTLAVDHDHNTGKIRGLLCKSCNTGLGLFEDSIERLKNAIEYLS